MKNNITKLILIKTLNYNCPAKPTHLMGCWQHKISSLYDAKYIKKVFNELPEKERMTVLEGAEMQYSFNFISDFKIEAKALKLSYLIELSGGEQIKEEIDLKIFKPCHFAIH